MTTEVRDFGDGATIVLFTNQDGLYQALREDKDMSKEVPYYQGDVLGPMIAVDLYFPKRATSRVLKVANHFNKTGQIISIKGGKYVREERSNTSAGNLERGRTHVSVGYRPKYVRRTKKGPQLSLC